MSLHDPLLSYPVVRRLRARSEALAVLCVLAAACTASDDLSEPPPADDTQARPEPSTAADPDSPVGNTVGSSRYSGDGARGDVVPTALDAGVGVSAPSAALATGTGWPGFPIGSGNLLANQDGAGPLGLDGGAPGLGLGSLSDDAGVSLACATDFAACVLLDVSASGRCLDKYADCEPGFRGDAGADGGLNGECAVHFSACVLNDPLGFESCFPELIDCK